MARMLDFLTLAAFVSAPAFAQPERSATIPKQEVVSEYAACVLKRSPDRVRELLGTSIGSPEERTIAKDLMVNMSSCANGRKFISMRTGEARGALAEAVLKSDAALAQSVQLLEAVPFARPTETEGRRFVTAYSQCLVSRAPDKARGLINTGYGSGEENSAMMAFGEALKDCMPEGFAYKIDTSDVRNHVASALYDRAMASPVDGDMNA